MEIYSIIVGDVSASTKTTDEADGKEHFPHSGTLPV